MLQKHMLSLVLVLRALGIPCRSVTNFESAHDHHKNITIDQYYDKDGQRIGNKELYRLIGKQQDSIWYVSKFFTH